MTTGLRRQDEAREGGSIPCSPVLGSRGTGVCLVSCSGELSLTHPGPSPRHRTQTQEAAGGGGLCLKPEVWWAPPPPHPTGPAPTLTHPGSSPSGGRPSSSNSAISTGDCPLPSPMGRTSVQPSVCPRVCPQHPEPQRLRSLGTGWGATSGISCCPSQAPPSLPRQLVGRVWGL